MYKDKIKEILVKNFVMEGGTPGISVTQSAQKQSDKENKKALKDTNKKMGEYEKKSKGSDDYSKVMAQNKYNYTDDAEETYHSEMEIMNGMEMLEYNSEPGQEFTKRSEEGLAGSSRMGNNPEWANVASKELGGDPEFGKKMIDRIKSTSKKRSDAEIQTYGMGDVQIPTGNKVQTAITAVSAKKPKGDKTKKLDENMNVEEGRTPTLGKGYTHFAIFKNTNKIVTGWDYKSLWDRYDKAYDNDSIKEYSRDDLMNDFPDNKLSDFKLVTREFLTKKGIDPSDTNNWFKPDSNINETKKEGMKRLRFNKNGDKPFNGFTLNEKVDSALKLIPENYKVDNKVFEMTDGNLECKIRWEGSLNEGQAIILSATDKNLVNEDMQRMKKLMGYKPEDSIGLVKGKARIDENNKFGDIWNKAKLIFEGENIESVKTKEGDLDDAVSHAPEAKKHVEGSVSNEKGTKAPKPKEGDLDDVVSHAPEAKKHIHMKESEEAEEINDTVEETEEEVEATTETTTPEKKETKVKVGDVDIPHAPEAKKHIHMGKGIQLGESFFQPISEDEINSLFKSLED